MKKLVTAIATCAIAIMVSAVESVNIVGYMNTTGTNGFTMYTPMFTSIGGGSNMLGDITGNFVGDVDTLQMLDENLVGSAIYFWSDLGSGTVWTSDFVNDDSAVTIPIGHSVVISSASAIIQNAGEVKKTATPVVCGTGFTTLGNPLPKAITLGDITFDGLVGDVDTLQILDENLVGTAIYFWSDLGSGTVWTSDFVNDDSGTILASGAGVVLSSQDGCTVTFPTAL